MLSYSQIAAALGAPLGTISAKLFIFNRHQRHNGLPELLPDSCDGPYNSHLFKASRLDEFRALLKFTTATRGPGRPRKDAK